MADPKQGDDLEIRIYPLLNNKPPTGLSAGKYLIIKKGETILEKTLGDGMVYSGGRLTITLTDTDTLNLVGSYTQECVLRDTDGVDFRPLVNEPINFIKTLGRLS